MIMDEVVVPNPPVSLPAFVSVPFKPLHAKLFRRVFNLILEKALFFNGEAQRKESPFQFRTPEQLQALIDFKLTKDGNSQGAVFEALEKVIQFSPHLAHPFYLNSSTAQDPCGIMADYISALMSTTVVTYFFAPVFTLMEEEVKREVRKLIGYSELNGDGLICPGGGFATILALRLAIHKKLPNLKTKGYAGIGKPKFCVFVSDHGYPLLQLQKAVLVLGLGLDACILVKTDQLGRMDVAALRNAYDKAITQNLVPVMVLATAGTPTLGAIDPIDEIAIFCTSENVWLHVDANYAGAYLLYEEGKTRLKGIEKSQSVHWSPTEMLCAPYCITLLLTKYDKLCMDTFGFGAAVVFKPTELYFNKYDNGDATIQTSRRPEIFKFWFMWKIKGKNGLGAHVKYLDDLSKYAVEEVRKRSPDLKLILNAYDTTRVSFQFKQRHKSLDNNISDGQFNMQLKNELLLKGKLEVGLSKIGDYSEFLTISINNSALTKQDIVYILDQIVYTGKKLSIPLFDVLGLQEPKVPSPPTESPNFVSIPIESQHKSLFKKTLDLVSTKALYFQNKRSETCYNYRDPTVLLKEFDFELMDKPIQGEDQLLKILEKVIFYSIHQAHPYYVCQLLSGGLDPYGIMADFVLTSLSTPMLTYEDSPVYTLMEEELFRASCERIGYPTNGDGLLCPGGSISVISAIHVAKVFKFPEIRTKGLISESSKKLVIYISKNAHYCFNKGSALQGIGQNNCIGIDVDDMGKMSVPALVKAIENTLKQGGTPFFVGVTAGTTVLGAFDPIIDIADVCEKYKLWLHIDGSVGGSVMMSDKYKALYLKGAERSDSISYNPHKMYGVVQETSIVVFRHKGVVRKAFGIKDPTKSTKSVLYDTWKYDENGVGGLQYNRRPNALKFWLIWKKKGITGLGEEVDYMYKLKDFAVQELNNRKDRFQIILPEFESPSVCFYYLPLTLRGLDRNSADFKTRVNNVGLPLVSITTLAGHILTGVLADPNYNIFLKLVLFSSGVTNDDIKYMLDEIDRQGKDMKV